MRHKIQFDLASSLVTKGEAPTAGVGGTEACAARTNFERPALAPSAEAGDRSIRRTAGYGPVCPVVWEGRSREAPPYPDVCRA